MIGLSSSLNSHNTLKNDGSEMIWREFDAEIAWWRLSIYGFLTKYGGVLSTIKLGEDLCVQIFTLLHARTVANICTPTVIFKLLFIKEEDKDTFQRFMTSHPPNEVPTQMSNPSIPVCGSSNPIHDAWRVLLQIKM